VYFTTKIVFEVLHSSSNWVQRATCHSFYLPESIPKLFQLSQSSQTPAWKVHLVRSVNKRTYMDK